MALTKNVILRIARRRLEGRTAPIPDAAMSPGPNRHAPSRERSPPCIISDDFDLSDPGRGCAARRRLPVRLQEGAGRSAQSSDLPRSRSASVDADDRDGLCALDCVSDARAEEHLSRWPAGSGRRPPPSAWSETMAGRFRVFAIDKSPSPLSERCCRRPTTRSRRPSALCAGGDAALLHPAMPAGVIVLTPPASRAVVAGAAPVVVRSLTNALLIVWTPELEVSRVLLSPASQIDPISSLLDLSLPLTKRLCGAVRLWRIHWSTG
jgi:hypothetical protein